MSQTIASDLALQKGTRQMTITPGTELLTVDEAAVRIGMSVRHVRRLVAERRIGHHRLGRAVRLHPADLDAYVATTRIEPLAEEHR
jgi:excisionase family DNA binding protein